MDRSGTDPLYALRVQWPSGAKIKGFGITRPNPQSNMLLTERWDGLCTSPATPAAIAPNPHLSSLDNRFIHCSTIHIIIIN